MRILLTGANGAFGALAAHELLRRGHRVAASMRDPAGRNAASAAALTAAGADVVEIDVTDDASVGSGTASAVDALGGLDALINVAGMGTYGLSEGFTSRQLLDIYDLNVVGIHRMMRASLPAMRVQGAGLVINVSSLLGRLSMPFYGPYSATKFAVETLSETYRVELAQFGVDVVLVEPGGFKTTWIESLVQPADAASLTGYGAFADAPAQTLAAVDALLDANPAQDPGKVATAIADLVEMPAGQRPVRTVIDFMGMAEAVLAMNERLSEATQGIYRGFGMDGLLKLAT